MTDTQDSVPKSPTEIFQAAVRAKDATFTSIPLSSRGMAPWSFSKLKVLDKCPFQFYLKYILKVKVPEDIQEKDDPTSANVGSAAHLVLEKAIVGKSINDSFAYAKKEFVPEKLSEEQWVEKVEPLEYNITQFVDRINSLNRRHPVRRVLTELEMAITHDWQATGLWAENAWFRGIIDLIVMLDNGDVIIVDHKTGGGMGGVKMYLPQLNSYKVLFHYGVSNVEGAQSGVHFIAAGEVNMGPYAPKDVIEGKHRKMLEWSVDTAIDKAKDLGFMKHIRGSYCKWCDYDQAGCKSGELKDLELSTKRFFPIKEIK